MIRFSLLSNHAIKVGLSGLILGGLLSAGLHAGFAQGYSKPGKSSPAPQLGNSGVGKPIFQESQGSRPYNMAFSPDGHKLAVALASGAIRIYAVPPDLKLDLKLQISKSTASIFGIAFNHNGRALAVSLSDGSVLLYQVSGLASGRTPRTIQAANGKYASAVAFHPTQDLLAVSSQDGSVKVWDVSKLFEDRANQPQSVTRYTSAHSKPALNLAFSPDGSYLASASADTFVTLSKGADKEKQPKPLTGHKQQVNWLAFSPDGETLVSAGADSVILWDYRHGKSLQTLAPSNGHESARTVSFGRGVSEGIVAVGYKEGTITLFDLNLHTQKTIMSPGPEVSAVSFSPDGALLAAATYADQLAVWRVNDLLGSAPGVPQHPEPGRGSDLKTTFPKPGKK